MPSKNSKPIYSYDWSCEFVDSDVVCNSTGDEPYIVRGFIPRHVCVKGTLTFLRKETVIPVCGFSLVEFIKDTNDEDVHITILPVSNDCEEYHVLHRISNNSTAHTEMSKCEVVRHTVDDALEEFSKVCEALTDDEHEAVMRAAKVVTKDLKKRWLYTYAARNNELQRLMERKFNND